MKEKPRVYANFDLPCELCGKRFKTPQGLAGHIQIVHSSAGPSPGAAVGRSSGAPGAPSSVAPEAGASGALSGGSAGQSVAELRAEVEGLQLQLKRRKLVAELPAAVAEPPDFMQQSGLGRFDDAVKAEVQRRAVGMAEQRPPEPHWLDRLLANPESLKLGIDALKGILGVRDRDGQSDNLSGLLKDLGFSLKDLITGASAPKATGLTVGGISLEGASLTPSLLDSIMKYKAAEEKSKADFESHKLMADALQDAIKELAPAIADLAAGRQGAPGPIQRQPGPGPEVQDLQPQFAECPVCRQGIAIPPGFTGGELHCEAKLADGSSCYGKIDLEVIPDDVARGKGKKKAKPEPGSSLKCSGCGQLIDVSDKPLGSTVRCPVCQDEFAIKSDTESLPAAEPLTDEERRGQAWRDAFNQGG